MKKILALVIVLICALGIQAYTVNDRYFEILKNMEIYTTIYKELNANYVDDIDPGELMKIGIDAMTNSLDPYTNYISEAQIENYRISTQGKYEGIGAVMRAMDGFPTIVDAFEGSPALKSGMRIGDQIVAINGMNTLGKNNEDVLQIFRGTPGTKVALTVNRPGVQDGIVIQLTREEISVPNVPHSEMVSKEIAYVSLTTFSDNASVNIRKSLNDLMRNNPEMKGVILDLRDNGGGLLREAIDVSNIFIPQGIPVVSTRGKVPERDQAYSTTKNTWNSEIPLAVLINKGSASASEIVSGVIQDYDRGVLIGQRSFGKGLVQNTTEVGYNSRLKLTTAKYYIPSNRCIQAVEYDNGEPVDIPDEKRSGFKTRNGRLVLDGGGITPDVKLEPKTYSEFSQTLLEQNIIFKYANQFVNEHDSIAKPKDFKFQDFDAFVTFAKKTDFTFESKAEKLLEELKSNFEKNKMPMNEEINNLTANVKTFYSNNFMNNKNEIIRLIEEEIIGRYYYQQGKVENRLAHDTEVQDAIQLLQSSEYQKLLNL